MFILLNTFWFIRTFKYVLFWLYLWQLKEYHTGRFLDHFKTHKGKVIFFNLFFAIKIILAIFFIFSSQFFSIWFSILLVIYIFETLIFVKQAFLKTVKKPVKTIKTLFLTTISIIIVGYCLFYISTQIFEAQQPFWLLISDIAVPLIVSFVVLLFQPFFVLARNNILKQATQKISKFKNLKVIGITGSYGKTSTKEFLTTILSKKYKVLSTKEHQNSEIGIAKCILNNLTEDYEIFVVEMGSYAKGGIKLLCDIVKPQIGLVVGVNEQHISLFGSLENLLSAEGGRELADSLPKDGMLILNGDNKYCLDLYKKANNLSAGKKKTYSINRGKINSDIWSEDISVLKNSLSFVAINKNKEAYHFKVNVLGKQNIQNLLASILVARELGMDLREISEASGNIKQEQGGMVLKSGKHGLNIIDSSYSANPDGVLADLDYLNIFGGKKIIVMPCLIELGKKSSEIHEKIGQKIGKICDIAIITTRENFKNIKKGAIYSGMEEKNIIFCENPNDIYSMITLLVTKNDAVLLEGRVPNKLIDLLSK